MKKKNKVLGPQVGYVEILEHYTNEIIAEKAETQHQRNPLRPSAAGKCARELAYEYREFKTGDKIEKELITPAVERIFDLGHSVEYHAIRQFRNAFKRMKKDPLSVKYGQQSLSFFRLPDGTLIEGSLDAVFYSEKHKALIDFKSKKDHFSSFSKTKWSETGVKLERMDSVQKFGEESFWVEDLDAFLEELNDAFFAANFYQLNMYFHDEHSFLRERGIDHAAIIQYNKNSSVLREVRFKPSQSVYNYVKQKFLTVATHAENDPEKVEKEFMLGSAKCGFCAFRSKCWEGKDALKEHFSTWPKKRWPKDADRLKSYKEMQEAFELYAAAQEAGEAAKLHEEKLLKLLDKEGVKKVRFSENDIYEVRELKSGGVGGGPRKVLRRSKL